MPPLRRTRKTRASDRATVLGAAENVVENVVDTQPNDTSQQQIQNQPPAQSQFQPLPPYQPIPQYNPVPFYNFNVHSQMPQQLQQQQLQMQPQNNLNVNEEQQDRGQQKEMIF